jgi:hypothetical protein
MAATKRDRQRRLFDDVDRQPVLISACLLGIPCRWHGRSPKKREKLIERLQKKDAWWRGGWRFRPPGPTHC